MRPPDQTAPLAARVIPVPRAFPPPAFTRGLLGGLAAAALAACGAPVREGRTPPSPVAAIEVPPIRAGAETADWWFRSGAAEAAGHGAMEGRARNVILFLGDGMSLATVAAARILDGQRKGATGEENRLAWERFPATALSRTYNTDAQTPDSAGTMSAIATGVKTRYGVVSVGPAPRRGDCIGARDAPLLTLLELARASNLATGLVTTTRLTHATPAATYAHSADRNWEDDSQLPATARAQGCVDIARQFAELPPTRVPDVVLAGGRLQFLPKTAHDPADPARPGLRTDGRNLLAEWQQRHPGGAYVWDPALLAAAGDATPLLGLFAADHLPYEHERSGSPAMPSLADLTRAAIARLAGLRDGYVLVVEGGRIDHAHHDGNAYRALTDTIAFSEAVQAAVDATSADDTLVLVTADHAHTLSFAGYPARGNPILGKVRGNARDGGTRLSTDATGLPYTTLGYANGPGYTGASVAQPEGAKRYPHAAREYQPASGRPDLSSIDTEAPDYLQEATLPLSAESHGGEDVGVWARGPGATAVRGSIEQHTLFHLMVQATPRLRERLCAQALCNSDGVPVGLPRVADFLPMDLAPADPLTGD